MDRRSRWRISDAGSSGIVGVGDRDEAGETVGAGDRWRCGRGLFLRFGLVCGVCGGVSLLGFVHTVSEAVVGLEGLVEVDITVEVEEIVEEEVNRVGKGIMGGGCGSGRMSAVGH